jgi:lysyl-tRNA synthetase class 2
MKPEQKSIQMTEDEKAVLNLLKSNSPMDLNALKEQTGLSNKKWDMAIKGLTKNKLARVEKTEEGNDLRGLNLLVGAFFVTRLSLVYPHQIS